MQITALCIISMTEIAKVVPSITYDWIAENNEDFLQMLFELGCNINQPIEYQPEVWHINRFGEKVFSDRWVAAERTDKEWINSGYASQAAIDKSKNNKLLIDLYRMKGQVE